MLDGEVARVLVGFDGSPTGQYAVDVAIAEAAARQVPLLVATVVDGVGQDVGYLRVCNEVALKVARRAEDVLGPGRVEHTVAVGRAPTELLRLCRPDDLLVVGSRGHRGSSRLLMGSTSSVLVSRAPCRMLVVREGDRQDAAPVVVGVDGTPAALAAASYAAALAAREGVRLLAVLAVPPGRWGPWDRAGPGESHLPLARAALARVVSAATEDVAGVDAREVVVRGHPETALLEHARRAHTLVLGFRGRGALATLLAGSVTRDVLLHCSAPVLVVHDRTRSPRRRRGRGGLRDLVGSYDPQQVPHGRKRVGERIG